MIKPTAGVDELALVSRPTPVPLGALAVGETLFPLDLERALGPEFRQCPRWSRYGRPSRRRLLTMRYSRPAAGVDIDIASSSPSERGPGVAGTRGAARR
jgi:hypothetical protein